MRKENGFGFVKRFRWRGPVAFAITAATIVMALLIFPAGAALAQTVLTNQEPTNENFSDSGGPYELGMTFSSTSAGNITAIRHWKAPDDNATHVGRIWDANGNQLAEVTFADNTGSGWKQQALTAPLAIDANTTYVVSVNSGAAGDSDSFYPFGSGTMGDPPVFPVNNGPLTGSQGVASSDPGSFPQQDFGFNYFRDVVFVAGGGEPTVCLRGEKYVSVNGPGGSFVRNSETTNNNTTFVLGENNIPADTVDIPMATFGGTPVFYKFVIKNCGDVDLYNVRIDDCIDERSVGEYGFLVGGADGNCVEDPRLIPYYRKVADKLAPGQSVTKFSNDFPGDPINPESYNFADICDTFGRKRIDGIVRNDSQVEAEADLDGDGYGEKFVFFDDLNLVQCKDQPCLKLEKQVSGDGGVNFFDADNCSDADVPFTADDAVYKLIVTNCGKEAVILDKIEDTDLGINLTLNPTVTIQPDDSVTFTNDAGQTQGQLQKVGACPNPDDQFENTATVSGTGAGSGAPVEATDPACVKCGPCIKIQKNVRDAENPDGTYQPANSCSEGIVVPINNGAEYRLRVSNCGAEALKDVVISDLLLEIVDFPVGDLAVDQAKTFFFDSPESGIPQLLQPNLCEEISPELQFLNRSRAEGTGVDSNITVTNSNPACVVCQPECNISVTKTCEVIEPDPGLFECDDKVDALKMIWDGPGTLLDVIAYRGDVGEATLPAIISTEVINGEDRQVVTVSGYQPSTNDVQWAWSSTGDSGVSEFHLSCSDSEMNGPEDCGKPQGNGKSNDDNFANVWLLDGLTTDKGFVFDCTPEASGGADQCTIQSQIADCKSIEALTGSKPEALTFQYTGGGCGATDSSQKPDDVSCEGSINPTEPVVVTDADGMTYTVAPGQAFVVPRDDADKFTLTNSGGIESLELHTSCSQPLITGEVYGSLTLAALDGVGIGANVRYLYEVANNGTGTITDISVVDDPLATSGVPGSPINALMGDDSQTLELTTFISETTTNTVTVNGTAPGVSECTANDTVTVTVLPPPPCEVTIAFDKLEDDKIKWKITNVGGRMATLETFVLDFPASYGVIEKVKLDGDIYEASKSSLVVGPGVPIKEGDWTGSDVSKRQLDPGETRDLEVEFTQKGDRSGWLDIDPVGGVNFAEGCEVKFPVVGGCALGDPTVLVFEYTGDACSATTNFQEGSFECEETGTLGNLVRVEMTKDANKFKVTVNGNEVTIAYDDDPGEKFPSEIEYKITGSTGTQSHKLHTSCSKPLSEGDQFGALILETFVPES